MAGLLDSAPVKMANSFLDEHVNNNLYEFCGCALLALVSHNTAVGSWQYAMAFTVVYLLHKTQLNSKFHGNPAFTFTSWLTGTSMSCFDVFKQVLFQIFGYSFGFWFGGLIGLTGHESATTPSDFAPMVFNEVISVGIMAWLYMHIHDDARNGAWKDFIGFAVGVAVWFGYQLKLDGAHLNAAIFAGEDFGKSIAAWNTPSWGLNDFVLFFAPLVSVFLTTLIYKFYHN